MKWKVYVATPLSPRLLAPLADRCEAICYQDQGLVPRQELLAQIRDVHGLLCGATLSVDAPVIDAAPQLRVISNIGVGFDNVDVAHASRRGIVVTNTPAVLSDAVAELTLALMLVMARRLPEAAQIVRRGRWDAAGINVPMGTDLKGKTLAIIGLGRIGSAVAQRALAFGMRVSYYDIRADIPEKEGLSRCRRLEEALGQADFLSLHVDLNPQSRRLIGARQLALMKPTAYLINTSRGAVVDQGALYEALRQGRLAGAALDVLEEEPPDPHDPLLQLPNVFIVPHIGSATREARTAVVELAIRNLLACLAGDPCEYVVNPAAVRPEE